MKLKRYIVCDMREGLNLIRQELGPDAVIISSRKIRQPGLRGFFSPPQLEVTAAVDEIVSTGRDNDNLRQELNEIKGMLEQAAVEKSLECETNELDQWKNILTKLELNKETIAQLLDSIRKNIDAQDNFTVDEELVKNSLAELLPSRKWDIDQGIYCFVGPTGVGKTTTLAKLAAKAVFEKNLDVGLITVDTYRIGAVEQLRIYAEIMDVPLKVVMSAVELQEAVAAFSAKDVIYIDTAGRPSKNTLQISELKSMLQGIDFTEKYLVLSSNMKNGDLLRVTEDFNSLNYTSLIFTKIDETNTLGPIVNVVNTIGKPVVYITNGQKVPDDIQVVDAGKLSEIIIKAVG